MKFGLLGALAFHDDHNVERPLRSPMLRALLAMLLLEANRTVSLDRVEALLWDGRPPRHSRASLHNHLARLRKFLGDDSRVRSTPGGLVLRVAEGELDSALLVRHLDAARAARLVGDWPRVVREADAALALWRGAPLDEFPALERDAAAQIAQWQEARLQARELRGDAALHLGLHADLLPELLRLVEEFPLRESFHTQLLRVFHRTDRRAEALGVYHRLRRTLVDTIGIEPGPAVRAAFQEVLDDEVPDGTHGTHGTHGKDTDGSGGADADGTRGNPGGAPGNTGGAGDAGGAGGGTAGGGGAAPGLLDAVRTAAAPMALPRDTASFTGHEDALKRLYAAVLGSGPDGTGPSGGAGAPGGTGASGVVGIHAVDGMPGIGKTTFAVHAAHRLKDAFPDGQIFLPLHAHTPGVPPVEPADALTGLLLAIGESPQRIPADVSARAGLWRSRLGGRRFLVVLDDARGSAQVEPLLPGTPGSLVLVTSRQRLEALDDAVPVTLALLSPAEAVRLLVAKAARADITADDPHVGRLAALCGHLPLALQLTAARLRHHRTWTTADLVEDLSAARGRLDALSSESLSVAAAFELSYRDLPPEQQALFGRLGLLPGDDFDAYAAAALQDLPLGTVRRMLGELENRHLLAEGARGRYRMHDLVREYARTVASADAPADARAAVERVLDYYLHTAVDAARLMVRSGEPELVPAAGRPSAAPVLDDREQAAGWLAAERANLLAVVEYAARHGHFAHAVQLPAAMSEFLRGHGHWNDALALHGTALDVALVTRDRFGQALAHHNTAMIQCLRGEYERSSAGFQRALDLFRELRDRHREGITLQGLARIRRLTGNYHAAERHLRDSLACLVELHDRQGQAQMYIDLGQIQQLTGRFAQAVQGLERALELHDEVGDRLGRANALTTLGDVLKSMGRYAESASRHRQALAFYQHMGNELGQANALSDLGDTLRLTGAYEEAAAGLERALALSRNVGNRLGAAQALTYLGRVELRTGELASAEKHLLEGLDVCEALGSAFGRAYVLMHLAEVRCRTGALSTALEGVLTSLGICRELEHREGEVAALNILGGIRLAGGDPGRALESYRDALAVAVEIQSPYDEFQALEGMGEALSASGGAGGGTECFRRALEIAERLRIPDAARLRERVAAG
ncbi:AfsR/SARP family transcriptional regulator [Streptomyces sp. NPDC050504]|uniref:AfsR/SARP family transcriptional regulator n=1 Tax=Streptomyces sp. NPDC050504 TaxID=3365618 RepID=UPI0037A2C9A6